MKAGKPAGFTLDGPRGPARVAQPGAVWLAMATGNPLLPFHLEASSCWTARSWDRTQMPKPFSTVGLAVGEPLYVPAARAGRGARSGEGRTRAPARRARSRGGPVVVEPLTRGIRRVRQVWWPPTY